MVFTRDLRVTDNPALRQATTTSAAVVPLFVLDDTQIAGPRQSATRLQFLLESLQDLDASLRGLGGSLVVRRGPWAETVLATALACGAGAIHLAGDVSGYAAGRVTRLRALAAQSGLAICAHEGITIVPPGLLRPPAGPFYQIFTPFYRRWLAAPRRPLLRSPGRVMLPADCEPGQLPRLEQLTGARPAATGLTGGERAGMQRLRHWSGRALPAYDETRDDLAADLTSRLSAYLHLGCLSPRTIEAAVQRCDASPSLVRQLAWRDFFCQVLAARPGAARADFRDRGDEWVSDPDSLGAWQEGHTGYPVVDAGMRQLAAEGFMHGRARMITASFLTKDLYADWRLGADHFLRHLVDADTACNQLNWQWVAGTGTDSNRYRVFSPTLQGRKYDASGDYVRRWVPELAQLPASRIHDPSPADRRAAGYPPPLVDHGAAISAYRARARRSRPAAAPARAAGRG
jgi:deoxyribodipyrimidine photo-lyase